MPIPRWHNGQEGPQIGPLFIQPMLLISLIFDHLESE
jgi:hypothetical protein